MKSSMLPNLIKLTGSQIRGQELFLLLEDKKQVVRQCYEDIKPLISFCEKNNLFYFLAPFQVKFVDSESFSNKGLRVQIGGHSVLYISKILQLAKQARDSELENDHIRLGTVLGYPRCCIDFFTKSFSEYNPNPMITSSNPFANITLRDKDICLLSHFPCKEDCSQSILLGKVHYECLYQEDSAYADFILTHLTTQK